MTFTEIQTLDIICIDLFNISLSNSIRIICIYVPPNTKIEFIEKLCNLLSTLCAVSYNKIIIGDFNFPNINWFSKQIKKKLIKKIFFPTLLKEAS